MPSRYAGAITQDWEPVVLSRPKPKAAETKSAIRAGAAVETVKKNDAGTNKKSAPVSARKLDEATEPVGLERVGAEVRSTIQRARMAKGMSQAELAKRINERAQVVQDYTTRAGKPCPATPCSPRWRRSSKSSLGGKIK